MYLSMDSVETFTSIASESKGKLFDRAEVSFSWDAHSKNVPQGAH